MRELKNKWIFAIVTVLITIALIQFCYNSNEFSSINLKNVGLEIFYTFNGCAVFLPFYVFLAFLANAYALDNFYKYKQTKFQNFIITRIGEKERTKQEIKTVLITSFVIRIVLHLLVTLVISIKYAPIMLNHTGDPSYYPETFFALSNNSILSFALFILYSSIGFAIFSLFLYSLIDFIKNQYVYKASGVLMSVLLVILPAFIGNIFLPGSNPHCYFETGFLYLIYSAGLLCPGIEVLKVNSYFLVNNIYFFINSISFIIISIGLICFSYKRRVKNG